jgi:hypothetical protein
MTRAKNKVVSKRVSLTGFVNPVLYVDVIEWLNRLPLGKRFTVVMNILNVIIGVLENSSGNDIDEIKDFINNNTSEVIIRRMKKRIISLKLRFEIFARDGYKCVICGRNADDGVKLHVDHIHPFSKGGLTKKENLRTLCLECNIGKGNMVINDEYIEKKRN